MQHEESHWSTVIYLLVGLTLSIAVWLWNDYKRTECGQRGGVWFAHAGACLRGVEKVRLP